MRWNNRISIIGIILLGVITFQARAEEGDITKFQIRPSGDTSRCLASGSPDGETQGSTEYLLKIASCTSSDAVFLKVGNYRQLVMVLPESVKSQWCLSRRVSSYGIDELYVSACLSGADDSQSWVFDDKGQLHKYTALGGKGEPIGVFNPVTTHSIGTLQGSFQWIKENPPATEWCYEIPWKTNCKRVCAVVTEQEQCPTDENQKNGEDPKGNGSSSGESGNNQSNEDGEKEPEKPEQEQRPPIPESEQPQPPQAPPPTSKQARWFNLMQVRVDQNICLDFREATIKDSKGLDTTIYRVEHQYCVLGRANQEWGHDLATKIIYNKGRGSDYCLTRTQTDILLSKCLDLKQINNSQRWYFSRGGIFSGVPWAALLSFTANNEGWLNLLYDEVNAGSYTIRPKYVDDCERVDGKCYDLPTGILQGSVPFYSN